jgi:hypothetical protein
MTKMSAQQEERVFSRCAEEINEIEYRQPTFSTVYRIIWCSISSFIVERPGQIIGSAFILLMLWGTHGKLELLGYIVPGWRGPGVDIGSRPQLIPGVPWDHELISFWLGAFLVVVIPILLIRFVYKQPLSAYGLGLPPKGRRRLAAVTLVFLVATAIPAFAIGTQDASMKATYPFYRPFDSLGAFVLYQLTYLPFFIAIEFIFRGYLLFGLAGVRDDEIQGQQASQPEPQPDKGLPGIYFFAKYALLIQMLSYTAWHLGKPVPELWGTLIWGLVAGATAYAVRSVWPIIIAHWLLNVLLDLIILRSLGMSPF